MIYDDTVFGNGKKGFFITNGYIYRNLNGKSNSTEKGKIALKEIDSLRINKPENLTQDFVIDGDFNGLVGIKAQEASTIIDFFNGLKKMIKIDENQADTL